MSGLKFIFVLYVELCMYDLIREELGPQNVTKVAYIIRPRP